MHHELTPRQIVAELDKYIIGQNEAKKSVAIALRNRWRRMNAPEAAAVARLGAAQQRVRDELLRASAVLQEDGVPGTEALGRRPDAREHGSWNSPVPFAPGRALEARLHWLGGEASRFLLLLRDPGGPGRARRGRGHGPCS